MYWLLVILCLKQYEAIKSQRWMKTLSYHPKEGKLRESQNSSCTHRGFFQGAEQSGVIFPKMRVQSSWRKVELRDKDPAETWIQLCLKITLPGFSWQQISLVVFCCCFFLFSLFFFLFFLISVPWQAAQGPVHCRQGPHYKAISPASRFSFILKTILGQISITHLTDLTIWRNPKPHPGSVRWVARLWLLLDMASSSPAQPGLWRDAKDLEKRKGTDQ